MALNMICQYVKNGVPILVLKDTGFMADILAFSSQEYKARYDRHCCAVWPEGKTHVVFYTEEAAHRLYRPSGKILVNG